MNDDQEPMYRSVEELARAAGWDAETLRQVRRDIELSAEQSAEREARTAIERAVRR